MADARELDAQIVIGADGCNGSSAKQLGLAEGVVHGVALEANYPYEQRFAGAMVIEIAVIRGGYGWVFPKGDHVNVGVGGNAEEGPRLRTELRRMCEAYGIDPDAARDTRGYRLPHAAAADPARPRPHRRDRRRRRARRPVQRRRDVRGVPLGEAGSRGVARSPRRPHRVPRPVPGSGRAGDHPADSRGLGGEAARSSSTRARPMRSRGCR